LKRYEYLYTKEGPVYTIEVPYMRIDLVAPEDMVEEIGRVYGYDKVTPELPNLDFTPKKNETYEKIARSRASLVAQGYKEVMTYAFANTGEIEVLASASDKKFLRTNLSDGLKKSYEMNRLNMPLLGVSEIKIFEIGTIFKGGAEVVHVGYADKKGVTEAELGAFFGKIVSFEGASEGSYLEEESFKPWSNYPFITRDIAVWVPEGTTPESLSEIYEEFGAEILRGKPTLFDQFTKNGRTSYAFRLVFQSYDRTLVDDEVNVIMGHINEKLALLGYEAR
jgi:phenylalanyl-tRNA synthetase beta subunit